MDPLRVEGGARQCGTTQFRSKTDPAVADAGLMQLFASHGFNMSQKIPAMTRHPDLTDGRVPANSIPDGPEPRTRFVVGGVR